MIIYNDIIPFKGYKILNVCGLLFVHKGTEVTATDLRHEAIHTRQCYEMLIIGFYLWYLFQWLFLLIYFHGDNHLAYRNICFEREAYMNEDNLDYLQNRKMFNWLNYY